MWVKDWMMMSTVTTKTEDGENLNLLFDYDPEKDGIRKPLTTNKCDPCGTQHIIRVRRANYSEDPKFYTSGVSGLVVTDQLSSEAPETAQPLAFSKDAGLHNWMQVCETLQDTEFQQSGGACFQEKVLEVLRRYEDWSIVDEPWSILERVEAVEVLNKDKIFLAGGTRMP